MCDYGTWSNHSASRSFDDAVDQFHSKADVVDFICLSKTNARSVDSISRVFSLIRSSVWGGAFVRNEATSWLIVTALDVVSTMNR